MPTVNFPCAHCGKLMAVTPDVLGRQVRCPHCQGVVTAPASSAPEPAATPAPAMQPLTEAEQDRLFGPLGGGEPRSEAASVAVQPQPDREPGSNLPSWMDAPPESASSPVERSAWPVAGEAPEPWPAAPPSGEPSPPGQELPSDVPVRAPVRIGDGRFLVLVIVPLISYSLFSTLAIVILWSHRASLSEDNERQRQELKKVYDELDQLRKEQRHGAAGAAPDTGLLSREVRPGTSGVSPSFDRESTNRAGVRSLSTAFFGPFCYRRNLRFRKSACHDSGNSLT